jgi:hypothetical protein
MSACRRSAVSNIEACRSFIEGRVSIIQGGTISWHMMQIGEKKN